MSKINQRLMRNFIDCNKDFLLNCKSDITLKNIWELLTYSCPNLMEHMIEIENLLCFNDFAILPQVLSPKHAASKRKKIYTWNIK